MKKDTKKILIVSQYFWPEEFRINELSSFMVDKGFSVTVLTGRPNYPSGIIFDEFINNPEKYQFFKNIEVVRIPLRPRRKGRINLALNYVSFVFWASILGTWHLKGKKFDSIFVFATSPITVAIPAIIVKKIKKIPMTIWVLDLWPDTLSSLNVLTENNFLYKIIKKITRWIYKNCDQILVTSEAFVPSIEKLTGTKKQIQYFPQWIETDYLNAIKNEMNYPQIRQKLDLWSDKFLIVFAGNLGEGQNFEAILDAAELIKSNTKVKWVIAGNGRLFEWIQNEIILRDLSKNMLMLGRLPSIQMPTLFNEASALLITLRKGEVFKRTIPGKLQSYLSSGKPILGMLDGEGRKVLELSGGGLCGPSGDSQQLASNISKLENMSDEKRELMGATGRKYALKNFDKERLISSMLLKLPFKK